MSIKQQAAKGMLWNTIERFSTQGIQFVLTIVIARILSPDDYGLVAMLGIFMAIAQTFIDGGFSNALIQKQNRTETDYCTTFYFNIGIAVFFYLLFFVSAPWISSFYHQPELTKLARVYCILLVTNSLAVVQIARFTVALDFRKLALSSLFSVIVGGSVGLWMAYHGYGVWALVFQPLVGSLVWLSSLWLFARWVPRKKFSRQSFRVLFSFGSKLLFSTMLNTLYTNAYSLVVGKVFQASILGYFNRAYTLGQFPVQNFGTIVQKVLYPIQCRYQHDDERFNRLFIIYLRISSFVLFPLMIGLSVLSAPVISLLLTDKWLPTAPLLQLVCIAFMWFPIMQANVSVLDAKGRTDYHFQSELIKKALAVLILLCTLPFGIECVCGGLILYSFVDMAVVVVYSRRLTSIGYKMQFKIIAPKFLLAGLMGLFMFLIINSVESPVYKVLIGSGAGIIFYSSLAFLFKFAEIKILKTLFVQKDIMEVIE